MLVSDTICKRLLYVNLDTHICVLHTTMLFIFSWINYNWVDNSGVLTWLVDILQIAELAGEKVHIISHIPPGNKDCLGAWGRNYAKIIER